MVEVCGPFNSTSFCVCGQCVFMALVCGVLVACELKDSVLQSLWVFMIVINEEEEYCIDSNSSIVCVV